MSDWPQHWLWRAPPTVPGAVAVFDLDGVLSDATPRQHILEGPGDSWRAFFDAVGGDHALTDQIALARLLAEQRSIVILTARPARVREITVDWLARHGVPWDLLIMRADEAWEGSTDFKAVELGCLRAFGFDVVLAFEDDPRNVAMYRDHGVPCVYIHSGYY